MKTRTSSAADYRSLTYPALGAGLIVALGAAPPIPVGFLPVPITMQSLGVMLAGLILGPRRGFLAVAVVAALVAMGFPVLSGGRGGVAVLVGPTAGYFYGWLAAVWLIGRFALYAERLDAIWPRRALLFAGCVGGGVLALHFAGVAWLALVTGLGWSKALLGTLLFVPGDLIKAAVAVAVAERIGALTTIDRR